MSTTKDNRIVQTYLFFNGNCEEAVAFYGSDAYKAPASIGSTEFGPIPIKLSDDPNDPEVRAIAGFLRVLNAIENRLPPVKAPVSLNIAGGCACSGGCSTSS